MAYLFNKFRGHQPVTFFS